MCMGWRARRRTSGRRTRGPGAPGGSGSRGRTRAGTALAPVAPAHRVAAEAGHVDQHQGRDGQRSGERQEEERLSGRRPERPAVRSAPGVRRRRLRRSTGSASDRRHDRRLGWVSMEVMARLGCGCRRHPSAPGAGLEGSGGQPAPLSPRRPGDPHPHQLLHQGLRQRRVDREPEGTTRLLYGAVSALSSGTPNRCGQVAQCA